MKILKEGKLPKYDEFQVTCGKCKTEFIYEENELHIDYKDGSYIVCPLKGCNQFISHNPHFKIK